MGSGCKRGDIRLGVERDWVAPQSGCGGWGEMAQHRQLPLSRLWERWDGGQVGEHKEVALERKTKGWGPGLGTKNTYVEVQQQRPTAPLSTQESSHNTNTKTPHVCSAQSRTRGERGVAEPM